MWRHGARAPRGLDQRRGLIGAPGEALNLLEESRQQRRAQSRPDAGEDDSGPETQRARIEQ